MTKLAEWGFAEASGNFLDTVASRALVPRDTGAHAVAGVCSPIASGVLGTATALTAWTVVMDVRLSSLQAGYGGFLASSAADFYLECQAGKIDFYFAGAQNDATTNLVAGTTYQVAVVRTAGAQRTLYINQVSHGAVAGADLNLSLSYSVAGGNGDDDLEGWVDNLRIFDTALTTTELAALTPVGGGGSTITANLADTAGGADTIARAVTYARGPADSAGGSDTITATWTRAVTVGDAAAGSDAITGPVSGGGSQSVADTATGTDSPTAAWSRDRSFGDTAGGTDTAGYAATWGRTVGDTASGSDALTRQAVTAPSLVAAISGRYFVDQQGTPLLLKGDSPWAAFSRLSTAQWDAYCSAKQAKGTNAVYLSLIGSTGNGGPSDTGATYDGIVPFTGGDLNTPNSTYWARVDTFLSVARSYGITVFAYVMDGWNTPPNGTVFKNKSQTDCAAYGTFLGNRYSSTAGLVWMVGGDYFPITNDPTNDPSTVDQQFYACLQAIRAAETTPRPRSIQLGYNVSHSFENGWWAPKVDFAFCYSYYPTYDVVKRSRAASTKPALFMEGNYEGENLGGGSEASAATTDETLRRQMLWAITAGSPGEFRGDEDWEMTGTGGPGGNGYVYYETTTSAVQMAALRARVAAWPGWHLLAPDNSIITSGKGTEWVWSGDGNNSNGIDVLDSDWATACTTPDKSLVVCYIPTQRTITLNSAKLGGSPSGTWVKASDNSTQAANLSALTPPSSGDWLLVVQGTGTGLDQSPADTAAGSDSVSTAITRGPTVADAAAGADTLTSARTVTVTIVDTAAGSDGVAGSTSGNQSITDTAGGADTLTGETGRTTALADAATGADGVTSAFARDAQLADVAAGSDTATVERTVTVVWSDLGAGGDQLTVQVSSAGDQTVADTAAGADQLGATADRTAVIGDTASGVDTVAAVYTRGMVAADTAAGSDTITAQVTAAGDRFLADTAAGTDVLTAAYTLARSVADAASGSDPLLIGGDRTITVTDTATGTDSVQVVTSTPGALPDRLTLTIDPPPYRLHIDGGTGA